MNYEGQTIYSCDSYIKSVYSIAAHVNVVIKIATPSGQLPGMAMKMLLKTVALGM